MKIVHTARIPLFPPDCKPAEDRAPDQLTLRDLHEHLAKIEHAPGRAIVEMDGDDGCHLEITWEEEV